MITRGMTLRGFGKRQNPAGKRRGFEADRVIFMDAGEIIENLPAQEFFNSPHTERAQQFLSKILQH